MNIFLLLENLYQELLNRSCKQNIILNGKLFVPPPQGDNEALLYLEIYDIWHLKDTFS